MGSPNRSIWWDAAAHNIFTQLNRTLTYPDPLYPPLPPSPPLFYFPLPRMMFTVKYVRVHLTNIKCSRVFVTYTTYADGVWTASSHMQRKMAYGLPLPTPHHHSNWDLEMSPMYPSPPPTAGSLSNTTPPTPLPYSRFRLGLKRIRPASIKPHH